MQRSPLRVTAGLIAVLVALGADTPPVGKVSAYAPAADLTAQVDFYVGRLSEALSNKATYGDETVQRAMEMDSGTLAVLALALAMHDEDHKLKSIAPALVEQSRALADNYADFDKASAALAQVKQALAGEVTAKGAATWEPVASMSALMKQVPVIYLSMKRGATDARRLKRQAAQTAGQAATLAAIAQASMFNTDHAEESQIPQWQQFCTQMRDAAGEVNAAVRATDAARAATAIQTMQKSCDDCHAVFRAGTEK
jgi:hypothetical protein